MCEPVFNMSVCCKVFATHSLCIIGLCASLGGLFKVVCSACFHGAGVWKLFPPLLLNWFVYHPLNTAMYKHKHSKQVYLYVFVLCCCAMNRVLCVPAFIFYPICLPTSGRCNCVGMYRHTYLRKAPYKLPCKLAALWRDEAQMTDVIHYLARNRHMKPPGRWARSFVYQCACAALGLTCMPVDV